MKQSPILDYAKANEVLRRGARNVLLGSAIAILSGAGLLVYFGPRMNWDPFFSVLVGSTFLSCIWFGRANYHRLTPRVSEQGFELRDRSGVTTVPWHAIQEITAGEQSIRIRAPGHPDIRIDLRAVRNARPLWDVIVARRPNAIRLTISEDELLARSAPLSMQWSLLPTSLRVASLAFVAHGLLSLVSFLVSSPPEFYQDQRAFGPLLRVLLIWAFALGILRREGKRWILGVLAFALLLESAATLFDLDPGTALPAGQVLIVSGLLLSIVIGFGAVCWPGRRKAAVHLPREIGADPTAY
ncbi:MAG: hypothetical protein ACJ8A6_06420 [Gemmatimonadales bacterium]